MRIEYPDIEPMAVQSARFYRRCGAGIVGYQPARVLQYKKSIGVLTLRGMSQLGISKTSEPIIIDALYFMFKTPKRVSKSQRELLETHVLFKSSRPDLDNLMKGFLDGIKGILIEDDNQVVSIEKVRKVYTDRCGIILSFDIVPRSYYL